MRPYLAVLKDAFREAMASRLLLIVLGLTTLVLIALAGFGLSDAAFVRFTAQDFYNEDKTAEQLLAASTADDKSAARRVWDLLPEAHRTSIQKGQKEPARRGPRRGLADRLAESFNDLLTKPDLYQAEYWTTAILNQETRKLIDQGSASLSASDLGKLNRNLIDAAFPNQIQNSGDPQPKITYFAMTIGSFDDPKRIISELLTVGMRLFIGTIGLIVAILVTASTIPQMFEPGAIDLLLSKPVSRVLLFITRFLGGCVFVLLVSAYLVTGIWLLCGVRLGIWYPRMLGCIPLFVFLFMIYYTISALTGVVWRNAIVSVILTGVFMLFCTALENYHYFAELIGFDQIRVARLLQAGDSLLAVQRNGSALRWNQPAGRWTPVPLVQPQDEAPNPGMMFVYPLAGPKYDAKEDRLVALQTEFRGGGQMGEFGQFGGSGKLLLAHRSENWKGILTIPAEGLVSEIFCRSDGAILTVGPGGIHRLEGDPHARQPPPLKLFGGALDLSRMNVPKNGAARWTSIGPDNLRLIGPLSAAMHPDGRLAVTDRDRVLVLNPSAEGKYAIQHQYKRDNNEAALTAFAGETIAVVQTRGRARLFDAKTLTAQKELQLLTTQKPREAILSDDGLWLCVLTHERFAVGCDVAKGEKVALPVTGQGDVTAMTFTPDGLLVADCYRRVTRYETGTWSYRERMNPGFDTWQFVNFYIIYPLYDLLPKPGDMSAGWTSYFLNRPQTEAVLAREDDLAATSHATDLWAPLWSNAAFVVVMLTIGSLYIWRKDF